MKKINLSGQTFGRLTVISEMRERKNGLVSWLCSCSCGKRAVVLTKTLRNGGTKSCGCLHIEKSSENINNFNEKNTKPCRATRLNNKGYYLIKTKHGWKKRATFELEKYLGRKLDDGEIAHHCDENKTNDAIENIELMLHGHHTKHHHIGSRRGEATKNKISDGLKKRVGIYGHSGKKLSKQNVIEIKTRLLAGDSYNLLARLFNVSKTNIASISKRKIWGKVNV